MQHTVISGCVRDRIAIEACDVCTKNTRCNSSNLIELLPIAYIHWPEGVAPLPKGTDTEAQDQTLMEELFSCLLFNLMSTRELLCILGNTIVNEFGPERFTECMVR